MKKVVIVGSAGQDGKILFDRLSRIQYAVVGIDQGTTQAKHCEPPGPVDILDTRGVRSLIEKLQPDEVYYLAAFHHSSEDKLPADDLELFQKSHEVHVRGLLNFLEAIWKTSPATRLFYAASSHLFGEDPRVVPQDEATPLNPQSIYAITKAEGLHCCRYYRSRHGLHVSVGILYNHESPLRRETFVAQKIAKGAVAIKHGVRDKLVLGDLQASIDWGYAPDYVEAMIRMVGQPEPDDYVVATGQAHTVLDFLQVAFDALGLHWKDHVREDPAIIRQRRGRLVGNAEKLRGRTHWEPSVTFEEMVKLLVEARENERTKK